MDNLTDISRKMYIKAYNIQSVPDAVIMLRECGSFRTLGDILRGRITSDQPKSVLVDGLCYNHPDASRDSIDKKVRNWLNGRTQTVAKRDAFELAQILKLDLEQTDLFLKQVTGEGIHWRDPSEIVWGYSIAQGLSYSDTIRLLRKASGFGADGSAANMTSYTEEVFQKVRPLLDLPEDAFISGLTAMNSSFGAFHNTAHRLFIQFLEILEGGDPGDFIDDGPKMTMRYILEHYLYRTQVPVVKRESQKASAGFNALQRSVRANWPDEQTLSKMKNREMDVSRKVLMMLFLATDGGEPDDDTDLDEWDEEPPSRDEVFQGVYTRMNRMLQACGFQQLDPRSPFDWIILFSIAVEDLWDSDLRMQEILREIFPGGTELQD